MSRIGISFQSDKSIAEYRELARVVDRYDFETVSVYQDLFFQPPWPALLQFAELTTGPLIGPAVVNPYLSHPVLVAGNLALVDELSRGRAYLGVGRGAYFDAIGVPQPRPLRAIQETIEVVQHLLRGDREAYRGELFQLEPESHLRFPIPNRGLPVLIGGWGEKTLALAGRIADVVKVGGAANPDSAPAFHARIEAGTEAAGRPKGSVRLMYGAVTVVNHDRRIAETVARRNVAMYVGVAGRLDPAYHVPEEELARVDQALAEGDETAAGEALSPESLDRFSVYGTPREITAKLESLFDAGVDLFELGTPHGIDEVSAIELLGDEVLPYFEED